jgi:hypothetical protein
MRLSRAVFVVLLLFVSVRLWSQNSYSFQTGSLVRLSFNTSPQHELASSICLAVSDNGHYRMLRPGAFGTEMLEGKMSEKQLQRLNALLENPEFQKIRGNSGGIIRSTWQSFGAEIFRDNHRQRVQWLDAEDTQPFPESVRRVIDWLLDFEPVHSKPFSYTEFPEVCPSGGMRPAQPLASK